MNRFERLGKFQASYFHFPLLEPGLLEALKFRVEAAEQKFRTAQLDDRLKEFEAARQRQVKYQRKKNKGSLFSKTFF